MYMFILFQEVHVPPTPEVDTLHSNSNSQLEEGQKLVSSDKSHQLVMQHDGNLVCYRHGGSVWSSHTNNKCAGPFCLVMQEDRNAVIYAHEHKSLWATGTCNHGIGPATLVMQNDGNIVIYGNDHGVIWSRF